MGIIKQVKAESLAKDARRAVEEGRSVFVARINQGATPGNLATSMSGVAEQIEAVEAAGWRMDHMAAFDYKSMSGSGVGLVCTFRRVA